tara:strand:+ start:264 stop:509 length:246 start_codon:yes stop_codon:yes gene_type:complete
MDRQGAEIIYNHIVKNVGERYFDVLYDNGIHYGMGITVAIAEAMLVHFEAIENYDRCIDIAGCIKEAEDIGGKYVFLHEEY